MADGAPGAYGLPVTKSVVKASVFALVPAQIRLPFMGTVVVPIIMSQGSVLLIDAQVSTMSTCTSASLIGRPVSVSRLSLGQFVSLSVCTSVSQSVSRSVSQSVRQSRVSQSVSHDQSVSQSVGHLI